MSRIQSLGFVFISIFILMVIYFSLGYSKTTEGLGLPPTPPFLVIPDNFNDEQISKRVEEGINMFQREESRVFTDFANITSEIDSYMSKVESRAIGELKRIQESDDNTESENIDKIKAIASKIQPKVNIVQDKAMSIFKRINNVLSTVKRM